MLVGSHQPFLLPPLEYYARMNAADVWIFDDTAKFSDLGTHSALFIRAPFGATKIKVPLKKLKGAALLSEVELKYPKKRNWSQKFEEALHSAYEASDFWEDVDWMLPILEGNPTRLLELLEGLHNAAVRELDITTELVWASSLGSSLASTPSDNLASWVKEVGGTVFCTGPSSLKVLDPKSFKKAELEVRNFFWDSPEYDQLYGGFVPSLSVLDTIYSVGIEQTKRLMRSSLKVGEGPWGEL